MKTLNVLVAWEEGLYNNDYNDIKGVKVESVNGNQATAYFEMESHDTKGNGDTEVKTFGGKWVLVKELTGWKLSESKIKELGSRTE